MKMETTWKPVPDFEGYYEVSDVGQVRSLKREKVHVLKNFPNKNYRYMQVMLWHGRKGKLCYVHRLVAEVFISNPNGYKYVTHIDGDRSNNCASNLKWIEKPDTRNQHSK